MNEKTHDRILDGALRRIRAERAGDRRWRGGVVTAVSAALAATALAAGVLLGRDSVPREQVLVATAADGMRMTATVTPADGWVRLHAVVTGVPPGERCHLVVTDTAGRHHQAGGWVASRGDDTALTGAALVAPAALRTVSVTTADGRMLVTATPDRRRSHRLSP